MKTLIEQELRQSGRMDKTYTTLDEAMNETSRTEGLRFLGSQRGQYIIGQALYLAVKQLEKVKGDRREPSNINDMRFLINTLFPIYRNIAELKPDLKPAFDSFKKEGKK